MKLPPADSERRLPAPAVEGRSFAQPIRQDLVKALLLVPAGSLIIGAALTTAEPTSSSRHAMAGIARITPDAIDRMPVMPHPTRVRAGTDMLFIGGQNALDGQGRVVGAGNVKAQTAQALNNLQMVLEAEGLALGHVITWNVRVVQGHSLDDSFTAFQQAWKGRSQPPPLTISIVKGLARPDLLVEVDAVAAAAPVSATPVITYP